MLLLARREEESIMVGDAVEITIVAVRGTRVTLGIAAPREVPVHRKEVYQANRRGRHAAEQQDQQSALMAVGDQAL